MRKLALMVLLCAFPLALFAARLTMKNGDVYYGTIVRSSDQSITFRYDNGATRQIPVNDVRSIDFEAQAAGYRERGYYQQDQQGAYPDQQNAYRDQNDWAVVEPGTQISVRTDENIDAQSANPGRTYPATITQDVVDRNGNVVIPRGSEAQLAVVGSNEGGTFTSGNLVLNLQSVQVNGRRYAVSTGTVSQSSGQGIGKNKRTAEMMGGGAALGTLVGALAGGGKGAAIGAATGAAAGGGVQVLTKGHQIRVPAETVLNFRLEEPLHLREMQ